LTAGGARCFEVHGVSPPDRYLSPLTEFRCAGQAIRGGIRAQEQGYDAFVVGHFQEPGLVECRAALRLVRYPRSIHAQAIRAF